MEKITIPAMYKVLCKAKEKEWEAKQLFSLCGISYVYGKKCTDQLKELGYIEVNKKGKTLMININEKGREFVQKPFIDAINELEVINIKE